MSRRPLLTVLAVAAIGLAACGSAEVADDVAAPAPTVDATTEPAAEETAPAVEDEGPGTDVVPTSPPAEQQPPAAVEDEGPGTDTPPAPAADPDADADGAVQPVTLAFDGREVPVAEACTGVDGAILATTEGEVTITLVREEGTALRYQAEGSSAETDEVTVEGGTDTTTYRATLSSPEVAPIAVTLVVMDDAVAALSSC
jgi:hypothetical protein